MGHLSAKTLVLMLRYHELQRKDMSVFVFVFLALRFLTVLRLMAYLFKGWLPYRLHQTVAVSALFANVKLVFLAFSLDS